ncbi:MAG: hypothetical protein FJX76_16700 [Armatimonadetes bacterium]|nr:hypothetical protein [Armatimonadota bacterium]
MQIAALGLTPTPAPRTAPDTMLYSDIDDTFIGWQEYNVGADEVAMARTRGVLNRDAERMVNGLSTSRGLIEIQRLAPLLKGFPLAFIGANNGQQLFVNAQGLPSEQWIAGLRQEQTDSAWSAEVGARTGGWSVPDVMDTLRGILSEDGFSPAPPLAAPLETLVNFTSGDKMVSFYPDQPSFAIRGTAGKLTDDHKKFGDALASRIKDRLGERGIQMNVRGFPYPGEQYICLLEPKNLDKSTLLEHVLGRYPSVHHVITAGDNTNDTMLFPERYGEVENHRVVSGDRKGVAEKFAGQPNVNTCSFGDIGPAIEAHLATIPRDRG